MPFMASFPIYPRPGPLLAARKHSQFVPGLALSPCDGHAGGVADNQPAPANANGPTDEGADDIDDAAPSTSPSDFAALLALAGVEEELALRSRVGFLAFHGGNLERMTDEIASVAAVRSDSSLYAVRQPAGMRHHLASNRVTPAASPLLAEFLDHVDVAIAIHGYGRDGLWTTLLLGGSNRPFAAQVGAALRVALPEFEVLDELSSIPRDLAGQHPNNPVNKPRFGGVQIELPPRIRGLTPHSAAMPRENGRIGWTNDLIAALATAAASWRPN